MIERKDGLNFFIRSSTPIGATLTPSLLESIFYPGNPLHDGAVLVRTNQIIDHTKFIICKKMLSLCHNHLIVILKGIMKLLIVLEGKKKSVPAPVKIPIH
ncbi:diadenylate cyclase [Domibacillus tundrae]|uniref:diadenylate cyclase n=1 Tax=Domibacillus tundrae TaxID=1587527 RepID=UPI003390FEAF